MKRLTLVRHAKSSWGDPGLADFERPLAERGMRDAPKMGKRLAAAGFAPDLLVASPARRALATAKRIAKAIGYARSEIQLDPELYGASPDQLLAVVRALPEGLGHVALVAHNPGLTELHNRLADVPIANIPTTGIVRLELDVDLWGEVDDGCARLVAFDYPKKA